MISANPERLTSILDTLPAYIAFVGTDLRYQFINDLYRKTFPDAEENSLIGQTVLEVLGPEAYEIAEPYLKKALRGERCTFEAEYVLKHGLRRFVCARYIPETDSTGEVTGITVFTTDITDQKKVEHELQISEKNYKYLFDQNAQMMAIWDLKTQKFLEVNEAMVIHYGYTRDEFLNMTILDIRPEEDREKFLKVAAVLTQDRADNVIFVHTKKDGTKFNASVSANDIFFKGKMARIVLITDVTARLAFEAERDSLLQEQRKSYETLQMIHEVGQTLTSTLELEVIVQKVTDAATKLTGADFGAFFYNVIADNNETYRLYSLSGVPREKFDQFPHPRATEVFKPTFVGAGTLRSDDITKDSRYGKSAPFYGLPEGHLPVKSYLAVSVVAHTGEVLGGLFFGSSKAGVFNEQHEKIVEGLASQTSIAIDNARLFQKLQKSLKARDEFLSMASHELKTPLTSLILQNEIKKQITDEKEPNPEVEKNLINNQTKLLFRLNRLIDDMLDVSRIRTGKLEMMSEIINLPELVEDIMERLMPQLHETLKEIDFTRCEEALIEGDSFRIEQVITNLLTNAMKYGDGKPLRVSVGVENNFAYVSIEDQGRGISPEDQSRIFNRFERIVAAPEASGLGLGLAIVKDIIEAHHGSITVKSSLGKGSVFKIHLPIVDISDVVR